MSAKNAPLIALLLAGCAAQTEPAPPSLETQDLATGYAAWAQACSDADDWDKPGPPFRIHGNSYYVGTCGIGAILVVGDAGHVLIDGGTAAGGEIIAANIQALGLRLSDLKLILSSHEHFDHVGGLAELQRRSDARVLASPAAAPALESGRSGPDDPQTGMLDPFAPVRVDGLLEDGAPVRLGELSLTPVFTPGHTRGALTWQWESCEGADCKTIVYADSLSAVSSDDYRFSDHPDYVAAYRAAIDKVEGLRCDILLTPHPMASAMRARLVAGDLTDSAACRTYAQAIRQRLDTRLAEEAAR